MVFMGAVVIVGISVFLILQPIIAGREAPVSSTGEEPSEAQFKKRVTLLQLRDAEYEYAMGKLGDQDYQTLRKELSSEALAAIRTEEAEARGLPAGDYEEADAEIEAEIAQVRIRLSGGAFCSECGHPNPGGSRFCAECGSPLRVPETSGQGQV
jgi:NADH pyrophosphatase NudC (nudix superfamily)